jgi:hypothetical protein
MDKRVGIALATVLKLYQAGSQYLMVGVVSMMRCFISIFSPTLLIDIFITCPSRTKMSNSDARTLTGLRR